MRDEKITDKRDIIPPKRGNGLLHREVWADGHGNVTRYNLAYINHRIFAKDNGRVVGYDNAHGTHHRHFMGKTEEVSYSTFSDIEARFMRDWKSVSHGRSK